MLLQIIYAGELSSNYELFMCNTDGFTVEPVAGNQLTTDSIKVVGTDESLSVNPSYDVMEPFTFQMSKIRNCEFLPITPLEYSKINRWLNRKESHEFRIDEPSWENIHYVGRINISPVMIGEKIYGVQCTFTSDYPYGFANDVEQKYEGKKFTVYNYSDEVGTIRPEYIKITCLESGVLSVTNTLDNEGACEVKNVEKDEVITFNSKRQLIESSINHKNLADDFNWIFPKLLNDYDNRLNEFESSLDIKFEVKYSPVRKVGIV